MKTRTIEYFLRGWSGAGWDYWQDVSGETEVDDLGTVTTIVRPEYSYGQADLERPVELIILLVDESGERHFRKQGFYTSYDGYRWDGLFEEVEQVTKTVTVWETKK